MTLATITGAGDTQSIPKINAAIVEADRVEGISVALAAETAARAAAVSAANSARITGDQAEAEQRAAADIELREDLDTLAGTDSAGREVLRKDTLADPGRPGEGRGFTMAPLGTLPNSAAPLTPSQQTVTADGQVAVVGSPGGVVSPLRLWRAEPGHDYLMRVVMRRAADPVAPATDAVRIAIRWLRSNLTTISESILADITNFTTVSGRQEYTYRYSLYGGDDDVASAPAGAIWAWPYVACHGGGITHIEVIERIDLSQSVEYSPDLSALLAQLNALTAQVEIAMGRTESVADMEDDSHDAAWFDRGTLDSARLGSDVVRTTGSQTVTGTKSFADEFLVGDPAEGDGSVYRVRKTSMGFYIDPPDGAGWQADNSLFHEYGASDAWGVQGDLLIGGSVTFGNSAASRTSLGVYSVAQTDAAIVAAFGTLNALVYRSAIDCSANPNYPAADAGHTYIVSVAGKIGGGSGTDVDVGDMLICKIDATASGTQAGVGANWNIVQFNVVSPLKAADIGVTVQAYDADLLAIAALAPTNDDILQRKSGAWTNRTPTQVATDLRAVSSWPVLVTAPVATGSTGTAGQIAYDSGFIYICVATDTWKRVAVATW